MGSLVMSPVAPGPGQHPHHYMMVDSKPHADAPSGTAAPSSRGRSASASTSTRHHDATEHPPATFRDESQDSASSHRPHHATHPHRRLDPSSLLATSDRRASPPSPRLQPTYRSTRSLGGSEATSPSRIKVRDLSHIRSFASEEYLARPRLGFRSSSHFSDAARQYEISSMPVADIIEMVAGLLTKITTTNDRQHEHYRPIPLTEEQSVLNPHASCVLAFHGKNIPGITILSYLSRIHKYCPTTYEVFLSLLVYFDRMTEMVNRDLLGDARKRVYDSPATAPESSTPTARSPMPMTMDSPQEHHDVSTPPASSGASMPDQRSPPAAAPSAGPNDLSQFFVVDSYNIHRLVIAGVTCASKFFSDVFYTNSRYAKVGGLPLAELNNLELQFLLLNDFRLSVPVEELEAYGTMLVEFYARELVAQQQTAQGLPPPGVSDGMYMASASASRAAGHPIPPPTE